MGSSYTHVLIFLGCPPSLGGPGLDNDNGHVYTWGHRFFMVVINLYFRNHRSFRKVARQRGRIVNRLSL